MNLTRPLCPAPAPAAPARRSLSAALAAAALAAAGCAGTTPPQTVDLPGLKRHTVLALTAGGELLQVNAAQPGHVLKRVTVQGLPAGDSLVGIDFRVARGVLYGLTRAGMLVTLDADSGRATPVGGAPVPAVAAMAGQRIGFDFNPTVDRIRVVGADGQNLRLHPDTGALVQADAALAYAAGDAHHGRAPSVTAAAYTYNKKDDKLTTNYAIDAAAGTLVMQGSREGAATPVSPNTGQLFTVGTLGLGALQDVSFDIADTDNMALAAVRSASQRGTQLVRVDLDSGRATPLGRLAGGEPLVGLAIVP